MPKFYITTSIMYTNAQPHIGFVLELLQADIIARWRRMKGDDVRFLTGTDEHGIKVARAADEAGIEPQKFVDDISDQVRSLTKKMNISNTDFIRTTDRQRHWPSVQKLWGVLADKGALYKKEYEGYYCVGHESFIKPSELEDGRCPLHKSLAEKIKEENWFFRLTDYKNEVRNRIESGELSMIPESRKKEILNLLEDAEDISFSRPAETLSWGIPVQGDPSQMMYVWADALTNYISSLDYASESDDFKAFWPADAHLVGKDIVRFHAMYWPAMLLAAGLELPKRLLVHGFINVDGQKMSKTLGNVIDPVKLLQQYEVETVRYYLARAIQSTDDSDFSYADLERRYESELANDLGNLVQRLATLLSRLDTVPVYTSELLEDSELQAFLDEGDYDSSMEQFRLHDALSRVWAHINETNAYINLHEPWKKEGSERAHVLLIAGAMLHHVSRLLQPFMPTIADKIFLTLGTHGSRGVASGDMLKPVMGEQLFPKKN